MTKCMSLYAPDQCFWKSVDEWGEVLPEWGRKWEILLGGNLIYMVVGTSPGVILIIQTFKPKNNIL